MLSFSNLKTLASVHAGFRATCTDQEILVLASVIVVDFFDLVVDYF